MDEGKHEFLSLVINQLKLEVDPNPVRVIQTEDYDEYLLKPGYFLRISFDSQAFSGQIENEKSFYGGEKVQHGVSPLGVAYMVTPAPSRFSLRDQGRHYLFDRNFGESYLQFANRRVSTDTVYEWLDEIFDNSKLSRFLSSDADESLHRYMGVTYDSLSLWIDSLRRSMKADKVISGHSFCHGDLNFDDILVDVRNDKFYPVNLRRSFMGHPAYDLSNMLMNIGVVGHTYQNYCKKITKKMGYPQEDWGVCWKLVAKKQLLEIVIAYLKEVYVYASSRPDEIAYLSAKLADLDSVFSEIPEYSENREFILSIVTEPILGLNYNEK